MKNFCLFPASVLVLSLTLGAAFPDPLARFRGKDIPQSALKDELIQIDTLSVKDEAGRRSALRRALEEYCGKMILIDLCEKEKITPDRKTAERYLENQHLDRRTHDELATKLDDPAFQRKAAIHFLLEKKFDRKLLEVDDTEIVKFYRENLPRFQIPENFLLEIIVVDSQEKAETVRARLLQGENFERVAQEYDPDHSGRTPSAAEAEALREIGRQLPVNGVSEIIAYDKRYYVLKLKGKTTAVFTPLEDIKGALKEEILGLKEAKLLQKLLNDELDAGNLEIFTAPDPV